MSIGRRIRWKLNARRHRQLDPPNMSEYFWSRWSMDEPTGEVFDRRAWSRWAARRRFRLNRGYRVRMVVERRFARMLTLQEVWESRDREDEWNAQREDDAEAGGHSPTGIERVKPPEQVPDGWESDGEWDPCWSFCEADEPGAVPVWFCEEAAARGLPASTEGERHG